MAGRKRVYVANTTFVCELNGADLAVRAEIDRFEEGHPVLRGRENLFDMIGEAPEVEAATAAPGEQRSRLSASSHARVRKG